MKFFKNAQSWVGQDKNNPFDFSNQLSGQTPEDVRKLSEEVSENVRKSVRKSVRGRSWMWKAARNAGFLNPYERITSITPFLSAVIVLAEIIRGESAAYVIRAMIITLGLILICNPWKMIERFIAIQSRILITINLSLVFVQMTKGCREWIGVIWWTAVTVLVVSVMNRKWLNTYNWFSSKSVISALVQAPDNSAVNAWNDHGKREIRTVYSETGMEYDDDVLVMYGKAPYIVGFLDAWKKTDAVERRAEKAERDVRSLKEQILAIEQEKTAINQKVDELQEELDKQTTKATSYEFRVELAEKAADELREENRKLREANDQLVESTPDKVMEVESIESKVINYLQVRENGKRKYSYQNISDMLDGKVGKTKIGDIAKAHNLN